MADKVIKPFPMMPDASEYEHLSQKQRMIAGYPYHTGNAELNDEIMRAQELLFKFNNTAPKERSQRQEIMRELLHPDAKDKEIEILPPFRCDYGYNISIGNDVWINYDCVFLDCCPIEIGDDSLFGPGVHIYTATHPLNAKHRLYKSESYYQYAKPVKIGRCVWIGGKSVICPGVTIGDNSVIGTGSIVVKDVPANVVVAGNPAKIIRYMEGADLS